MKEELNWSLYFPGNKKENRCIPNARRAFPMALSVARWHHWKVAQFPLFTISSQSPCSMVAHWPWKKDGARKRIKNWQMKKVTNNFRIKAALHSKTQTSSDNSADQVSAFPGIDLACWRHQVVFELMPWQRDESRDSETHSISEFIWTVKSCVFTIRASWRFNLLF